MSLHPQLTAFAQTDGIKKLNKLFLMLESDLQPLGVIDLNVEIIELDGNTGKLKRFFSLESVATPHRILLVRGVYRSFRFSVSLPVRSSNTLPYSISVQLPISPRFSSEYKQGLLGAKWHVSEGNKAVEKVLKTLKMPKIVWSHTAALGHVKVRVPVGSILAPSQDDPKITEWIIFSGYHGFARQGPKVALYLVEIESVAAVLKQTEVLFPSPL